MLQLTLFGGRAKARRREVGPALGKAATSRAAAEPLRGQPALSQRERVLEALEAAGESGATREELAAATGVRLASVCGRVNELLRLCLASESGAMRVTSSGRSAAVVVAR